QFLDDRPRALAEMQRVLKPGGRIALSTWCDLSESPYFDALVQAVAHHVDSDTAMGLGAAFALSDPTTIQALVAQAGFRDCETTIEEMHLQLPDLRDFVPRHVSATPMAMGFRSATHEQQDAVIQEMVEKMALYRTQDGFRIPFRTHLVKAMRPIG